MRKFNARWWSGPDLVQWRYMAECGEYPAPFFWWPRSWLFLDDDGAMLLRQLSLYETSVRVDL